MGFGNEPSKIRNDRLWKRFLIFEFSSDNGWRKNEDFYVTEKIRFVFSVHRYTKVKRARMHSFVDATLDCDPLPNSILPLAVTRTKLTIHLQTLEATLLPSPLPALPVPSNLQRITRSEKSKYYSRDVR